jgi:hypothetical protein
VGAFGQEKEKLIKMQKKDEDRSWMVGIRERPKEDIQQKSKK